MGNITNQKINLYTITASQQHIQFKMKCVIVVALLLCLFEVPVHGSECDCIEIKVTVPKFLSSFGGTYDQMSEEVGGRTAWHKKGKKQAEIWYHEETHDWYIGQLLMGKRRIMTLGREGAKWNCPSNIKEEKGKSQWQYWHKKEKKWTKHKQIKVKCLKTAKKD